MTEPARAGGRPRGGRVAGATVGVPARLTRPAALLAALLWVSCEPSPADARYDVTEKTILELQADMREGRVTSARLVDLYLDRVRAYDRAGPALNTIVRLNPRARARADSLDAERSAGTVRGPLHGIPVLMKDNYDVAWMPTTGSSLALAGLRPPDDAHQVARLREAGAVILGKTNLHELAAGITTISSLGGQTRNAYDPARNPGGSSGGTGVAVAASFAAVGWGTDTCGSIRIPAAVHNLFGLRPTKGLSSIDGILPLSHSQDTGGPLARTATDLAIALDATVGMDAADPATAILEGRGAPAFREALDPAALDGARIGALDIEEGTAGSVARVIRGALEEMEALGATVVDVSIPELDRLLARTGLIDFDFKFDLADYLAGIPDAPVTSLGEILDAGLHHEALDRTFRRRNARSERDTPELAETLERRRALAAAVVDFMDREDLDALAYPTMRQETALIGAAPAGATCSLSAHTGLPALRRPCRVHRQRTAGGAGAAGTGAGRRAPGRHGLRLRVGRPEAARSHAHAAARPRRGPRAAAHRRRNRTTAARFGPRWNSTSPPACSRTGSICRRPHPAMSTAPCCAAVPPARTARWWCCAWAAPERPPWRARPRSRRGSWAISWTATWSSRCGPAARPTRGRSTPPGPHPSATRRRPRKAARGQTLPAFER